MISREFDSRGVEDDPERIGPILAALEGADADRRAVLQLIGGNEKLLGRPEVLTAIRRLMNRDEAVPGLLPVLRWPIIKDAEVLAIVLHGWPKFSPSERLQAVEALFAPAGSARPGRAARDGDGGRSAGRSAIRLRPCATVRCAASTRCRRSWAGKGSNKLVCSALADDDPALRRRGLTLASTKVGFWNRADTDEYLKRLLVDSDVQVRRLALATVEEHGLVRRQPGLARRVKALVADPELGPRARSLLINQGADLEAVTPTSP